MIVESGSSVTGVTLTIAEMPPSLQWWAVVDASMSVLEMESMSDLSQSLSHPGMNSQTH